MSRTEASGRRMRARTRRARPAVEGLEGRQLLSGGASPRAASRTDATPGGVLSSKGQVFRYVTITGGIATLRVVGVGSLAGTSVDSNGALHVVYGGTNVYSKVVGTISGGGGHAPLASIDNLQLIQTGQPNSLSGTGGTPLASVLMNGFDLVPGGSINLTPGVTGVVLHSIGPNTNVQLRNLPPHPSYRILPANPGNSAGGESGLYGQLASSSSSVSLGSTVSTSSGTTNTGTATGTTTTTTSNGTTNVGNTGAIAIGGGSPTETIIGTTIVPIVTGNSSLSNGGSIGASSTLEAGQSATITTAQGVTLTYVSDGGRDQVLANVGGTFTATPNILEPLAPGQPATEPPAPPGIILKVQSIGGPGVAPANPLTDSKIFAYDPSTGHLLRFDLNLQTDTGVVDPSFAPIAVPGAPATSDIDLAHNGGQLVVLASSGTTVYAYDAQTGAPAGSFTTAVPVSFVATAGNITVLGSTQNNQLHMIDLPASLRTGLAVGLDSTTPFVPLPEVTLLGGLTGVPGSNNLYATIGAHFSTLQPNEVQLGIENIGTLAVTPTPEGTVVQDQFTVNSRTGLITNGNYSTIETNPIPPTQPGAALGAVDQNLALDTGVSAGKNVLKLYAPNSLATRGAITLAYPNLLTGLSQSFRTDLGGPALINVQGDIQSIRGTSANGMFLNDTGNLATVKIQHLDNTVVVGQPVSHIVTRSRNHVVILSSARLAGGRNGVTQVLNIQPIGPVTSNG